MTQAKPKFATFEKYLEFDDGTDNRYEFIDQDDRSLRSPHFPQLQLTPAQLFEN